ncbi:hypothetical protein AB1Y20_010589 [Prymnesium parvum]|uniref:UBX domain-containing protein 11 n=1 Tax=Prymnesium parvum TaxID=97485 RepID=A0AB34IQ73_PRYPA
MTAPQRFPLKDPRPLGGAVALNRPPPAPPPLVPRAPRHPVAHDEGPLEELRAPPSLTSEDPPAWKSGATPPSAADAPPAAAADAASPAARALLFERLLRTQETELCAKEREIQRLLDANKQLQRENRELHRFLADYGMQWVGPDAEARRAAPPARGGRGEGADSGAPPDMEAVRRSVCELNAMAETGGADIVRRRDGSHGLGLTPPTLTLTFWRGGLQLNDGAVRGYAQPATVAFLRDLLDGFFPYELKEAYPEGVLFLLADKRHLRAEEGGEPPPHEWGSGRRLDSRQASRLGSARSQRGDVGEAARGGATLSRGASRLPADGVWHPSSADPTNGQERPPSRQEAPSAPDWASAAARGAYPYRGASAAADAAAPRSGEVARIQVKGTSGAVALVKEFAVETTVQELRQLIEELGVVRPGQSYELRTPFPPRTLADGRSTLASAGLTPSATLLVTPVVPMRSGR